MIRGQQDICWTISKERAKRHADKPAGRRRRPRAQGYVTGKGSCSLHVPAGDEAAVPRGDGGQPASTLPPRPGPSQQLRVLFPTRSSSTSSSVAPSPEARDPLPPGTEPHRRCPCARRPARALCWAPTGSAARSAAGGRTGRGARPPEAAMGRRPSLQPGAGGRRAAPAGAPRIYLPGERSGRRGPPGHRGRGACWKSLFDRPLPVSGLGAPCAQTRPVHGERATRWRETEAPRPARPPARKPGAGAGHSPQTAALGGSAVCVASQRRLEGRHVLRDHGHLTLHQQDVLRGGPGTRR